MPANSLLDLIGNTPLLEITHLPRGVCRLFVKLENQNPGGSIKDRIGLSMIEAAERDGRLKPGGTIVEATAGNTGLGLALVASQKGYKLMLVVPDKMAREKIFNLRALGSRSRAHALGCRQGTRRVLPGHGQAHRSRDRRVLRRPVRQSRQSRSAREDHRPGNLGADGARTWMRSCAASARAAR